MDQVDLAKKANPCLRNEEHKKEHNQITDEWLAHKVGVSQTDKRRNCCSQNNLSKTQNLTMVAAYDYKGLRVIAYPRRTP